MIKIAVFAALVGIALSSPVGPPAYPPPPPPPAYHPAPGYAKPVEKLPPQPFAYQYGVKDDYSGNNYSKDEAQNAEGVVTGSYTIALPDGRVQTVRYTADHYNGFVADVSYEGVPQYPPEPKGGYGHLPPPPAYHPAPA